MFVVEIHRLNNHEKSISRVSYSEKYENYNKK